MVNVKSGNDYKIAELKEFLQAKGLSIHGNKAELISRLENFNSNIWAELSAENDDISEESSDMLNQTVTAPTKSRTVETTVRGSEVSELDLMRRERDLLRRELELARREIEIANRVSLGTSSSSISGNSIASIDAVKRMLSEFDGTGSGFCRWGQQVELLRLTYSLDENATKLLITSKLQGKAIDWFHSKSEHIMLSATELLQRMKKMFDHRPSKMTLRKDFENRIWQNNESFSAYYHDKVILANQVPIEEDEIIDYVIDGVPDEQLRHQARLHCFDDGSRLLKAFEKISLKSGPKKTFGKQDKSKNEAKADQGSRTDALPAHRGQLRCFNCHEKGHRSSECQKPRAKTACFRCGSTDHRINSCPQEEARTDNSTNVVHSVDVSEPYMVPMRYEISDKEGNTCNYSIKAMIDTGSPISLIKSDYVPDSCRAKVNSNSNFFGFNGSRLELLGTFEKDVKINNIGMRIKFFVVPNETMACVALLGRNFTSHSGVKVMINEDVEITENRCDSRMDESANVCNQIMHVDSRGESSKKSEALNIVARVNHDVTVKVRERYNNICMTSVQSKTLQDKQPISFRACRLAYADKGKLGTILDVDKNGIRASTRNVESVVNYPVPRNTKEVQRFIGLASCFRRFVPRFSIVAKPLYDLLKEDAKFTFGTDEHDAFETLKKCLCGRSPMLADV